MIEEDALQEASDGGRRASGNEATELAREGQVDPCDMAVAVAISKAFPESVTHGRERDCRYCG